MEGIAGQLAAALACLAAVDVEDLAKRNDHATGAQIEKRQLGLSRLIDELIEQASWLTPSSPIGATLAYLLLVAAQNEACDADDPVEQAKWKRQSARFEDGLLRYHAAQAGRSVADLGLSGLWANRSEDWRHPAFASFAPGKFGHA